MKRLNNRFYGCKSFMKHVSSTIVKDYCKSSTVDNFEQTFFECNSRFSSSFIIIVSYLCHRFVTLSIHRADDDMNDMTVMNQCSCQQKQKRLLQYNDWCLLAHWSHKLNCTVYHKYMNVSCKHQNMFWFG